MTGYRSKEERIVLWGGGIVLAVLIGLGLLWLGYTLGRGGVGVSPAATPTATLQPPPTVDIVVIVPTDTPLPPTATPLPTAIPPTDTPIIPMITAGANGLNVRSGPGTNFRILTHVDPGTTFVVTGRYADWWQIDYNGTAAWANSGVVTAVNTDGVPVVVPPPSPIPPTPVPPTVVPPTMPPTAAASPAPPAPDARGMVVRSFTVGTKVKDKQEVQPQASYGNVGDVWFCFDVVNSTAGGITLTKVGGWAQPGGKEHFQVSWGASGPFTVPAGGKVGGQVWCDHFYNDKEPKFGAGTHQIWLRMCFQDGYCVNAAGPITIKIG